MGDSHHQMGALCHNTAASSSWSMQQRLFPGRGAEPWAPIPAPHSQDTPWELHVREPVQWVLGTQRQPVLGHCLRGWGQMSSWLPWAELGSFLIPLGCTGILSYTSRMSWDPSSSL